MRWSVRRQPKLNGVRMACAFRSALKVPQSPTSTLGKTMLGTTVAYQFFGFRIKTMSGLPVARLRIGGKDEASAVSKLKQMYPGCEILEQWVERSVFDRWQAPVLPLVSQPEPELTGIIRSVA